jgi:hypothetical protein
MGTSNIDAALAPFVSVFYENVFNISFFFAIIGLWGHACLSDALLQAHCPSEFWTEYFRNSREEKLHTFNFPFVL